MVCAGSSSGPFEIVGIQPDENVSPVKRKAKMSSHDLFMLILLLSPGLLLSVILMVTFAAGG